MPTFAALVDDFEDGTLNTTLWSGSYGDPDETGGRARIPCTTGYAGLKSGSLYTLTGSGITIRLYPPTPGGAASAAASCLVLTATGGTDGGFIVDPAQNAVGLYLREGYADAGAVFLTYNATDHAWLRFRENAGTLYWDTSPDGTAWTNQRTAITPAWAAGADLAFLIEGHRDAGTNDFVEVGSVNAGPGQTITGAASGTGTGIAAATGTLRALGTATLIADGAATAAAVRRRLGSAALTTAGNAAATGTLRAVGSVHLAGETSLTATPVARRLAASAATADAAATAVSTRTARASAILTAAGSATVAEAAIDYGFSAGAPHTAWEVGPPWL